MKIEIYDKTNWNEIDYKSAPEPRLMVLEECRKFNLKEYK
jgi:hypothetical protein